MASLRQLLFSWACVLIVAATGPWGCTPASAHSHGQTSDPSRHEEAKPSRKSIGVVVRTGRLRPGGGVGVDTLGAGLHKARNAPT